MANDVNDIGRETDFTFEMASQSGTSLATGNTTSTTTTGKALTNFEVDYGPVPMAGYMGGNITLTSGVSPPAHTEKVEKPGKVKIQDIEIGDVIKELGREAEEVLGYTGLSSQVKKAEGRKPLLDVLRNLGIELLDHAAVVKYKAAKSYTGLGVWESTEISKIALPVPEHVLSKAIQIKKEMPAVKFYVESLRADPDPFLYAEYNGERYYIEVWDEPEFEHPGLK